MEEKRNKMWQGVFIGAIVGAAVTMFDRDTRENTMNCFKKNCSSTWDVLKNPAETAEKVSQGASKFQQRAKVVADDTVFILQKLREIVETAPEVVDAAKKTKTHVKQLQEDVKKEVTEERGE
ncbi:hypothetical protein LC040_19035 [Bacillus tianshenii]|nr:hypothetical protein LC040_19035 [Bacillus tianshenii]